MENDLFNPSNIRKSRNNLNKNGNLALKEIKSWDDKEIRAQDKGSRLKFCRMMIMKVTYNIKLSLAHLQKQTLIIVRTLKKKLIHGFRNGPQKE